jgi:hypothetical protein
MVITCGRTLVGDDSTDSTPQSVNILALHFKDFETVSLEGLGQLIAFEILGRVTSDGDVIII